MKFITRNQQVEEELPETYVKYPYLIPFLKVTENESENHRDPFEVLDYFTRTHNDIELSRYDRIINRTINIIHFILSSSYNIIQKNHSRAGSVTYLIFSDTRMGGISIDFSSAADNPHLENYVVKTKHRLDLDEVINNLDNQEVVIHFILSYCNSIVAYAKKKHITNDFIFYNDTTGKYCKVGLDEVEESDYKHLVEFLESYWKKVNTKTAIDIINKTAPYSNKVYITEIDYIKE